MADILVRLLAGDDEEKSFVLSREFAADVARLSSVVSRAPPAAAPEPGKRGDPITMGAIVIAAVSGSGALTASGVRAASNAALGLWGGEA
jgi:hypothetical protein